MQLQSMRLRAVTFQLNVAVMSIIGTIHEDVTTDVVGQIGSWQWLVTFICTMLMVPAIFNQYEDIFMLYPSNIICIPPLSYPLPRQNLCSYSSEENGTQEIYKCSKWNIKLMSLIWLQKSWLVFCEQRIKLLSTAIICRFGLVFGFVIFGLVSDSFGRKTAIIISISTSVALELTLTFCDSEGWFRLVVFLKSLIGSAYLFIGLLLICEIASNRWRSTLNTIVMIPRLLAIVCTVPLANAAPNMETYGFIACLFLSACILLLRWCPESPQWLLYNRKINVAETILKNAAKMNGIQLCSEFKIRPVNQSAYNCLDETTTCIRSITTPNIRTTFILMSSFWMIFYFLWSSLYVRVYSEDRSGDFLLKVFCFIAVFGALTFIASKKLLFRYLLETQVILTGAATISIPFARLEMIRIITSSIAIAAGMIVHALLLNITPRLFAINIRANAFGCCHAIGQLGSIISYIIYLFQPISEVLFVIITFVTTVTLVALCFLMPDIDGRELPDVMGDMDYYSELSKPLRWATQKTNSPSAEEIEMRVYSFGSALAMPHRSNSNTREPPQRIGFARLRRIADYLHKIVARRK